MNKKQKTVILIGTFVILLMALFPPWNYVGLLTGQAFPPRPYGYSFILNTGQYLKLNLNLLVIQEAIVLLTVIGLVLFLKDD